MLQLGLPKVPQVNLLIAGRSRRFEYMFKCHLRAECVPISDDIDVIGHFATADDRIRLVVSQDVVVHYEGVAIQP